MSSTAHQGIPFHSNVSNLPVPPRGETEPPSVGPRRVQKGKAPALSPKNASVPTGTKILQTPEERLAELEKFKAARAASKNGSSSRINNNGESMVFAGKKRRQAA
jgi:hypothetical protein